MLPSTYDWAAAGNRLRSPELRGEWDEVVGGRDVEDLLGGVADALNIRPPAWFFSFFGLPSSWLPTRHFSEFGLAYPWRPLRAAKFLSDVLLPSVPLTAPAWVPDPISWAFWHPSLIDQRPDHNNSWTSYPNEHWFFINGILHDDRLSQLNAAYLAYLFHRPLTLIENSTGGVLEDLTECALDKAFGRTGEAATKAFPAIYDALKDPAKEKVVVIAHSQGTIIAGVVLRFMALLMSADASTRRARVLAPPEQVYPDAMPLNPSDFEPLSEDEIAKLELYCFANCATKMRYLTRDSSNPIPWIESYGNEFDIVARLGVLAPNPTERGVHIDGPRYEHKGMWGHLFNTHYLPAIEQAQKKGRKRGPKQESAAPFVLLNAEDYPHAQVPRLYRYLNGGSPPSVQATSSIAATLGRDAAEQASRATVPKRAETPRKSSGTTPAADPRGRKPHGNSLPLRKRKLDGTTARVGRGPVVDWPGWACDSPRASLVAAVKRYGAL